MRRWRAVLRSFALWTVALPVFAACCLLVLTAALIHRGKALDTLIKASCRLVLMCCGIRVRTRGGGNMVPGRQYVVMMNHVNFFDPLVFYTGFPGLARGVEEESHFRWPLYGLVLRRIGMIPIARKDTARAIESLARASRLVGERPDHSIAILPEGTRSPDGKLGTFKKGGFHLALETGLDILPVIQKGAYAINRKGSLLIRPGVVEMIVRPAVPVAGYTRETVGGLAERTRGIFLELLGA
ncbi:MAG: 1-acyl-sn-glycerol-3-phosphate acyltransferase [Candidatus Aminicenantes bacterium]|nr:1-acyl-sn-glycerol-3-phosphate acyltransferase [Candidatus Aminicenantes bacterium]